MSKLRPSAGLSQFFSKLRQKLLDNWHYLLVLTFSVVATVGLWGSIDSVIVRSDGYFHTLRLQSAAAALKNGQLIPQISPDGADGFGYAYNIFYGPLTSYIAALFRLLHFSWPVAINLTYIFLLIVSGLVMCYAAYKISQNKVIAALSGVLYLFAPYHLVDLFQRVAIGEFAALTFAPLMFLGLYRLVNAEQHAVRCIVISVTAMLLSHNLSLVIFAIAAVIFGLFYAKNLLNVSVLCSSILAVLIILGLSAFYLVPLAEAKFVGDYGIFDSDYAEGYFEANSRSLNAKRLSMADLVWGEYDIDSSVASNASIGLIALFTIIAFPFVCKKVGNRSERKFIIVLYAISVIMLLLTTAFINWNLMPSFILKMQFPWRFLSVFCVTICFVEGYVIYTLCSDVDLKKQGLFVIIIGLIAASNVSKLFDGMPSGARLSSGKMPVDDIARGSAGWQAEYLPIQLLCNDSECGRKVSSQFLSTRNKEIEILSGSASISGVQCDGLRVSFHIDTQDGASVELPLVFYPGYKAVANGVLLDVGYSERAGLVEVEIPSKFSGTVDVYYGLSAGTAVGVGVSLLTVASVGVALFMWSRNKRK